MSGVIIDLQRRVSELEATIRALQKDKQELYDDLEGRLVQREGSFWASSSVVTDRLTQAESDRQRLRSELSRVTAERDSLREDMLQVQSAKQASDKISKSEMDKNRVVERELTFYKKQCARALEERNLYSYEVEELKRTNLELERSGEETTVRLENALRRGEEVDAQREEATAHVARLEERLAELARIPELETQLQTVRQQRNELQSQHTKLQSLYKVLQEDIEGAWATVDQLKEEKDAVVTDLEDVQAKLNLAIETEKAKTSDLERKLQTTSAELKERKSQLRNAESLVAASQAQVELFQEFRQQEVQEARDEAHETIQRLQLRLEETEGLLSCKMAEVKAAVEAKVTAQETASEWESKCHQTQQRVQELEKRHSDRPGLLSRRSLETASFRSTRGDRNLWFRWKGRSSEGRSPTPEANNESLLNVLDLVVALVPKLKAVRDGLEAAEPGRTGSRRASLSRLETVQVKLADLQKELQGYPLSPFLDDERGRLSAHVTIGMEAVGLASYGIASLKQFINAAR